MRIVMNKNGKKVKACWLLKSLITEIKIICIIFRYVFWNECQKGIINSILVVLTEGEEVVLKVTHI